MPAPHRPATRRGRGFQPAARLVQDRIRTVGESRGFAISRLLTHWAEIVGDDIARVARPVKVGYRRDSFGATLTLLTTGAAAPVLQMQLPQIRERVNACYGYNAISRVVLTQTAPEGFAEGQAHFTPAPPAHTAPDDPVLGARAATLAAGAGDDDLRAALEALARTVLTRDRKRKDKADG
jgi:hypothetical protein